MTTAIERGDLAERLLPIAAQLACLVHGDGDRRDIEQVIARLDRTQRDALLVVLAALVDPDAPMQQALGYVTWDEHGRPAGAVQTDQSEGTIRDLAEQATVMPGRTSRAAVIVENTAELARYGLPRDVIAERLGVTWGAVCVSHTRQGVRLPELAA